MGFFSNLFKSYNDRELAKIEKTVDKIEALEPQFEAMSDDELRACTDKYKERIQNGEKLEDVLVEAFATVREASKRVLGMRHFRVQLIGGIVLFQGRIAEMRTGEGKTLVATLAAYLAALEGKGVHVVTVNEYLAKRDAEWMGKIYKFLGLTVGINLTQASPDYKRAQYNCDIMYTTNNELGFDYLRDNMVNDKSQMVQRGLHFAIIDEVDSILIDEARTPLIISGRGQKSADTYIAANRFVKTLTPDDYELQEKEKTVFLNESGSEKAEKFFGIENLADYENQELKHYIDNALRANIIMKKEKDYLVIDNEIIIVDEFTGRQMIGRRYSNGLHQAIEAKENVPIKSENKTLATITFQNLFRLYPKLSGMTGTASTEKNEFASIYSLDIVEIPTNKPVIRIDRNDQLYMTKRAKYNAVIRDVIECYQKGQPVLVGTVSVDKSEELSNLLKRNKIPHNVLNAKNHEKEAEIVAQAGKLRAVTIATNMAGRGTDILLGGNAEFLTREKLEKMGYNHELIEIASSHATIDPENKDALKARADYEKYYELFKADVDKEKEEVVKAGGLKIIGTERHESRRIDNQLRGRSGRQGDPGISRFYIGLDDDLMKIFGGNAITKVYDTLGADEDMPIQSRMISSAVENAQKKVEGRNFSIRKNVLKYDDVMNTQREIIYKQRREVLDGENIKDSVMGMMDSTVENIVIAFADEENVNVDEALLLEIQTTLGLSKETLGLNEGDKLKSQELIEKLKDAVHAKYAEKEEMVGSEELREIERVITLKVVDDQWMEHIDNMDELKNGIGLRAYGQKDPVVQYRIEGFDMFDEMVESIKIDITKALLHLERTDNVQREEAAQITDASLRDTAITLVDGDISEKEGGVNKTVVNKEPKVGRNDLCPCGSGKKYKNCCGRNQ